MAPDLEKLKWHANGRSGAPWAALAITVMIILLLYWRS